MRLICNDLHIKNCAHKLRVVVCCGAVESVGVVGSLLLLYSSAQFKKTKVPAEPTPAPTKLSADT